jgi:hypothetical protein
MLARVVIATVVMVPLSSRAISCIVASMATIVYALRINVISVGPPIVICLARGGILVPMVISIMVPLFVARVVRDAIMSAYGDGE